MAADNALGVEAETIEEDEPNWKQDDVRNKEVAQFIIEEIWARVDVGAEIICERKRKDDRECVAEK